jgi:hypothetical protein
MGIGFWGWGFEDRALHYHWSGQCADTLPTPQAVTSQHIPGDNTQSFGPVIVIVVRWHTSADIIDVELGVWNC